VAGFAPAPKFHEYEVMVPELVFENVVELLIQIAWLPALKSATGTTAKISLQGDKKQMDRIRHLSNAFI
jgi:hypothetical protein